MQSVEVIGNKNSLVNRAKSAATQAKFFLDIFQEQGILVLASAGAKPYADSLILGTLFSMLDEVGESYVHMNHTMLDFHPSKHRERPVKVIARKSLFGASWTQVVTTEELVKLQSSCTPRADDLQKLFSGQNPLPIVVTEGKENEKLREILAQDGKSSSKVFLMNFAETGNKRLNRPEVHVYTQKKAPD